MGFQDVVLLPSRASFRPYFFKSVVEVRVSGLPFVLKLSLRVNKGMFNVKNLWSKKYYLLWLCNFIEIKNKNR